jgi:hypothetical protein
MLPSGSPAARLSTRPAATSILGLLLLLGGTLGAQPIVRLGAMGDSLSDEYFESTYDYAHSWTELVVAGRGGQERVAGAVRDFSLAIRSLADEKHLVFADGRTLTRQLFGTNGAPRATLLVGNVGIDMNGVDTTSGSIPTAAFVDDGVHPNTVIQGILANLFLAALRHYGAPEELFSEAEILAHAGLAYGGSDTLLGELEATFEDYVVDYFVLFSDGFESSDTGSWSFAIP